MRSNSIDAIQIMEDAKDSVQSIAVSSYEIISG